MFSDQKGHLLIWYLKGKDLFWGKSLYYLELELYSFYYLLKHDKSTFFFLLKQNS